jgi:integrase/recombinase XerD
MTASRKDVPAELPARSRGRVTAPASLAEAIDAYLAFVEMEKGRSKNTVLGYENDLAQFALFAAEHCGLADWRSLRADVMEGWQAQLAREGYSSASSARKTTAVRGFLRYLADEGRTGGALADGLHGPRLARKLPGTLEVEDLEKLLNAPSAASAQGLRDRAIMELTYSSGLRVSEICSMRIENLDLQSGLLRVIAGKGSKDRVVPVGRPAVKALEKYLVTARPSFVRPKSGGQVFLSNRGGPISRKTVWYLIKLYSERAGLDPRKVKPHLLRHCFATHLLAGGADLRVIQEMLGHADIATTQIYTKVDASRNLEEHAAFHPRKRLGGHGAVAEASPEAPASPRPNPLDSNLRSRADSPSGSGRKT